MKKTKYIKYNRTRREEFQIRTCIVEEDGKQYVEDGFKRTGSRSYSFNEREIRPSDQPESAGSS